MSNQPLSRAQRRERSAFARGVVAGRRSSLHGVYRWLVIVASGLETKGELEAAQFTNNLALVQKAVLDAEDAQAAKALASSNGHATGKAGRILE